LYVGGDTSKFGVGQTQLTFNNLGGWPSLGGSNGIALYVNNQQAVVYTNLIATHQFRLNVNNITSSTSTTTGALVVSGGVGIGGNANIGNILSLTVSTAAPASPAVGMFAVADRVTWDPASKGSGNAYPVFYNGATWNALY
jgi:hypothetical protein